MGLAEYLAANYGDEKTKKHKGERPRKRRKGDRLEEKPNIQSLETKPEVETVYRDDQGRKIVKVDATKDLTRIDTPIQQTTLNKYARDIKKDRARLEDPMTPAVEITEIERVAGIPQFKGHFSPNRFGIAPSYKWDGIDRSNGFEEKWLERHST